MTICLQNFWLTEQFYSPEPTEICNIELKLYSFETASGKNVILKWAMRLDLSMKYST